MSYYFPKSLIEALDILDRNDSRIVAGGTDFFPSLIRGRALNHIVDLTGIKDLKGIVPSKSGWRIGAATSWTEIVNTPLPKCFDGLKVAAREVGSIQIQNSGTIAGNLCNASPAADGVPPLLALDARVDVTSANGNRTLALSDFVLGPRKVDLRKGELVTAIFVPALPETAGGSFQKLGSRKYMVISIAMVAAVVVMDGNGVIDYIRIAVGSCSPVARRLPNLEAALSGLSANQVHEFSITDSKHFPELSPISDVRGSAEYRIDAVAELCRRAVIGATST